MSQYCIYTLSDPRNGEVRYVGMSKDPMKRFQMHKQKPFLDRQYLKKSAWLKDLKSNNLQPKLEVIEEVEGNQSDTHLREMHWIGYYMLQGALLINIEMFNVSLVNVKAMRLLAGLTTRELSNQTNIPYYILCKIENDPLYRPCMGDLESIAQTLKIDTNSLIRPQTQLAPTLTKGDRVLWLSYDPDDPYRRGAKVIEVNPQTPRRVRIFTDERVGVIHDFLVNPAYLYKVN